MRVKRTTAWHQPRDETVPPTYQCNVALLEEKVISRSVCVILGDYQPRWYWFAPVSLSMSRQKRIPRSPPPPTYKVRSFQIQNFPDLEVSNFQLCMQGVGGDAEISGSRKRGNLELAGAASSPLTVKSQVLNLFF